MSIKQLHTIEDLHQFVQQSGQQPLFKHSTSCPISAKAYEEFQAFVKETDTPAAVFLVIEDRLVSNKIAEEFGIKHESPQIFLLEDGKVRWNASHWKITRESIKEALTQ
ncbi:bacillithiol system redox-active protein YtxJ [Thermaerobacillus caldiproteolyticus]|uniref:bacillithiol system redox-active protein YtxJ n=1 Tax=Thermaerobacillus caldiproteolyticus TaxID=247480 RepID=UPI00188D4B2B|nr:bacillithiol system redox-active protein YtxJ [Anoxybacillus caldiproteolyticus]QPA30923.1 bacillithiol system redox-active protein YtxJ [Anoxybacillus caldiproteolyticus]